MDMIFSCTGVIFLAGIGLYLILRAKQNRTRTDYEDYATLIGFRKKY